jgi:hypothetical protein
VDNAISSSLNGETQLVLLHYTKEKGAQQKSHRPYGGPTDPKETPQLSFNIFYLRRKKADAETKHNQGSQEKKTPAVFPFPYSIPYAHPHQPTSLMQLNTKLTKETMKKENKVLVWKKQADY